MHTHHLQARPRFFKITSKIGNWSGIAIVSIGEAEFHICVFHLVAGSNVPREGDKKLNKIGNARIGFMSSSSAVAHLTLVREAMTASSKTI